MILLVSSNKDLASINIRKQVLSQHHFSQIEVFYQGSPLLSAEINGKNVILVTLEEESIGAQNLTSDFPNADLAVFISRHSSQSGKPTLSVHVPGNFGVAEFGGLPGTVSVAPGLAMQSALKTLFRQNELLHLGYDVSYECTHHGPSLNVPSMFVELGSSSVQWEDTQAASAVAYAALEAIATFEVNASFPSVIGVGGTHYNQKFTKMSLSGEAVFGHMFAKYAASLFSVEMLRQCIKKTLENVVLAVLDWKGIKSEDKQIVISALQEVGLPFRKV